MCMYLCIALPSVWIQHVSHTCISSTSAPKLMYVRVRSCTSKRACEPQMQKHAKLRIYDIIEATARSTALSPSQIRVFLDGRCEPDGQFALASPKSTSSQCDERAGCDLVHVLHRWCKDMHATLEECGARAGSVRVVEPHVFAGMDGGGISQVCM